MTGGRPVLRKRRFTRNARRSLSRTRSSGPNVLFDRSLIDVLVDQHFAFEIALFPPPKGERKYVLNIGCPT